MLVYQEDYMQTVYINLPELIMGDAIYKLQYFPVYIMLVIDGEGLSKIIAIFMVSEETNLIMRYAVELFKKNNPACSKTVTIFSDRDSNEQQTLTKFFLMRSYHFT